MIDVEVLVAGGGPAGLLTAACLAKRHRVALIDRAALGTTSKYWVTTERRLVKHGLADCILHRAPAMVLGTFLGSRVATSGDLAVVNDELLLRVLIDRCRQRDVILAENSELLNLCW